MIRLFNTLTRTKEEFTPLHEGEVRMYNCGPTVYNYVHIGNLRSFLLADILRRVLEYNDYKVHQVMNITDVGHLVSNDDEGEDKMEKGARREGKRVKDIADMYTKAFMRNIAELNILSAENYPKATEHIQEQIDLIKKLEEKGFTYVTGDGVYFDSSKFPQYTELAKLDVEGMKDGARIKHNPEKKNPTDFALWKFFMEEGEREQEWESPWGVGFPGWHIECSAMSMKYLGETLDIHTGGVDHVPVHHTNERAQSESATGKPFSRFWIHHEFVNVEDGKMAKSGENFVRLETLKEHGVIPHAYRYWILTSHYRTMVRFSYEAVEGAQTALLKLYGVVAGLGEETGRINSEYQKRFLDALNDDLGTPEAIALVWELVKDGDISPADKKATLLDFDRVLGLDLAHAVQYISTTLSHNELPVPVQNLLKERQNARDNKDWKRADVLRDELFKMGYKVKDTSDGQEVMTAN